MTKVAVVQMTTYDSNIKGIKKAEEIISDLAQKNTDIVCFPEQWLKNNKLDFEQDLSSLKKLAKDYQMTVIPGAFYEKTSKGYSISSPVIDPSGSIIGKQEKIHPFDYENKLINPGTTTKIFSTQCKFGIIICYDMVFPNVANSLVKKGAEILLSPSRIVKRGINPWHMYVQVRSLENRIPILASNVMNYRFGGKSIIVDLVERNKVVIPNITKLTKEGALVKNFNLKRYIKSRKKRFSDSRKFS
ncbi:MAG: carbon-nitrogen hydrolase family protein [Nitrosopumilaceae archaeon]|nr:carbon-nitrogen hydrolase family protein [Nitrosopumilaceae archaeon]NIT99752.1 carbon-nitrogen hydrolase family protein [Nitrosopumilaceae archaeon]NIU88614.1 carbon-nitrogen hydrolase family protein [Nitrosopumilaceae archaeon]NIV64888.1 carbon-nitrogen hydrolase family protein [Nitrosopumilaceae archaeon]NIX60355.1 carbon-nitrogen hydrolase family protein [Nitrosopumilaceae archaeon]